MGYVSNRMPKCSDATRKAIDLSDPEWKVYQQEVASFLVQLGFETRTDETIAGARASHDIDVTARISVAGVNQLWVVECKKWKRPVPKERALTFVGIVNDIGADRGLIFSESGFQAGAIRATGSTNVTLTSLSDFEQNYSGEIASVRARVLNERIVTLEQKFASLWQLDSDERERIFGRYVGPNSLGIPGACWNWSKYWGATIRAESRSGRRPAREMAGRLLPARHRRRRDFRC